MKKYSSVLLLAVFLSFSSCSSLGGLNPLSLLTGNNWVLNSLMGKALDPSKLLGKIPSLSFLDGGKLAGNTGCNNFNGKFALDGKNLSLDPGAMTKMACAGDAGKMETDFLGALAQVKNLKVGKDKLTLMDGAKELMSFIPQAK
ncbi:META domain-containing protein [Mariniradius sediminis]|uniref:META domain-containing protein n=1 Tax=Mariniradius sediminis TaxID=2909237 RepID=A0ABS9BWN7_9BACT|nr:META domain-containing protein [Mariniradius sediminis]MCF1752040.1 META domain-containing protein [Mariniradius sediminis]